MSENLEKIVLDFMQMEEFAKDPFVFSEARASASATRTAASTSTGCPACSPSAWARQPRHHRRHHRPVEAAFAPPLHGTNPAAIELVEALSPLRRRASARSSC